MLRGTLWFDAALQLGGALICVLTAAQMAMLGTYAEIGFYMLLAVVFVVTAGFIGTLALRPRAMPIALVMVANAASGVVAFMLLAAGQVEPAASAPLVAVTGLVLLGLAGLLFLELRKVTN